VSALHDGRLALPVWPGADRRVLPRARPLHPRPHGVRPAVACHSPRRAVPELYPRSGIGDRHHGRIAGMSTGGPPLRGFWMAGFESACHINRAGCRLDLASATRHRAQADEDYRLITSEGLTVSRESIPWNQVDRDGRYDFSVIEPLITAAGRHQVQVLWTLCHWGWPDGLDPLSEAFVDRMAWYAGAA